MASIGLAFAAFAAVRQGIVDEASGDAIREMQLHAQGKGNPADLSASIERLEHVDRKTAAVHELLGLARLNGLGIPKDVESARNDFAAAIQARSGLGYTWASLASAKYRLGDTGPSFERALENAARLAPHEPEVQQQIAYLGLALIDQVGAPAKAAIEKTLASGMKRNPSEILQISARRGRLDVACRYVADAPRPSHDKWTRLCQSMEATP